MTSGSTGSIFPKWQLAVLIGAPLALGLGYLYYRNQSTPFEEDHGDGAKDKKKLGNRKDASLSVDEDQPELSAADKKEEKQYTPLQRAINYKNEGNVKFKNAKYNDAIELYDLAIETCPGTHPTDLATFYQNRAAAFEQLKKWTEVKQDCTKALELNSRYVKALHRRARAHEGSDNLIESLEDITATCILEGFQNNSSLVFADRVLKELGRRDARIAFKNRCAVYPSKHFIRTYISTFTNDPSLNSKVETGPDVKGFDKARASLYENRIEEAIEACTYENEATDRRHSLKLHAMLLRGTMFMLTGRANEALNDFGTIIDSEQVPANHKANAYIKRAALYAQNDHHELGFADFESAVLLQPDNADIYLQRGQVYTLLEQLDNAIADFTKAIELAPKSCSAYVQKCYVQYRQACMKQDHDGMIKAIQACEEGLKLFPDSIETYNVMAQIYTEQQQYERADGLFKLAIKIAPEVASLYVHRGLLFLQWSGDIPTALENLNKAIDIDDKCELAYETLGTIQVQRGQLEHAVELFEKALKLTRTEMEMVHLYSLRNAAIAQLNVAKKLGLDLSSLSALTTGSV